MHLGRETDLKSRTTDVRAARSQAPSDFSVRTRMTESVREAVRREVSLGVVRLVTGLEDTAQKLAAFILGGPVRSGSSRTLRTTDIMNTAECRALPCNGVSFRTAHANPHR